MARNPRQPRRPVKSEDGGWTALTPEKQASIVADIRSGAYAVVAAKKAGISDVALRRWLKQGQDIVSYTEDGDPVVTPGPEPYRSLRLAIEGAEAELEAELSASWVRMAQRNRFDNPQGISTFLAKRFRERWADSNRLEVSGPEGGPVEVKHADGDDVGYLAGILDALARAGVVAIPGADDDVAGDAEAEADPVRHP